MAGLGTNPRYGWDPSPNYPQGDSFGFGYGVLPVYDGPIPPPPPGYGWFDIGSNIALPAPAHAWGMPGAFTPAPWNPASPHGADRAPAVPAGFPGASFRNTQGGVGMEPGYGYIFPASHCKIHVINSAAPPWLSAGPHEKKCFHVPTSITVKELMQQFGCTNADAARNRLVELTQGADGTWYKGVELKGSEEKKMEKRIDEIGWNVKRNGVDADFVWLWFAKV